MQTPHMIPLAKAALFTITEIKAAVEAFDRGEANAFDAMDAVLVAIEGYRAALPPHRKAA